MEDLLGRLTMAEKISLFQYNSPGVPRLGIPTYNWWSEGLHGVGRAGRATVFPQAIGLAATFDDQLLQEVSSVIGDEARAKYNAAKKNDNRSQYIGLTFWSPNINIFRDPRWGRGHETYGEDPYLTGRMGSAFVRGMQGNDPRFYKAVACAKHYAVHSGPEPSRHEFNAMISNSDLYNTYLPAFKTLVTDAKVGGVMCAYNRVDSLPCCNNPFLLQTILRKEWGFKGYVVTDCWALSDVVSGHHYVQTEAEAAALAIKNGVNVECGASMKGLQTALDNKWVNAAEIDAALRNNLSILFKLGWFDPEGTNPYDKIPASVVDNEAHRKLAYKAAQESIVLLSNKNHTLPLQNTLKNIFVTGPNADATNVLLANYNGNSGNLTTILEGITNKINAGTTLGYDKGCELTDTSKQSMYWMINDADAVVAVLGLSPLLEGENGDAALSEAGGDKKDIRFPYAQLKYLRALRAKTKKPLIVVVTTGSAVELKEVEEIADAVLLAWYPGEEGGNAVADVIFGNTNPGGRLPVTFYQSNEQLPDFNDYSMKGRTYRYFDGPVQHSFGFGLSYTQFSYSNFKVNTSTNDFKCNFTLTNTGDRDGEEVVQVYVKRHDKKDAEPGLQLKQFQRVALKKGMTKQMSISLPSSSFLFWDEATKAWTVYPGDYEIGIGSSATDIKQTERITIR